MFSRSERKVGTSQWSGPTPRVLGTGGRRGGTRQLPTAPGIGLFASRRNFNAVNDVAKEPTANGPPLTVSQAARKQFATGQTTKLASVKGETSKEKSKNGSEFGAKYKTKPLVKSDSKLGAKDETKGVRGEIKPGGIKSDTKFGVKSKNEIVKSGTKPVKNETKREVKAGTRAGIKTESKEVSKSGSNSDAKRDTRLRGKDESKTVDGSRGSGGIYGERRIVKTRVKPEEMNKFARRTLSEDRQRSENQRAYERSTKVISKPSCNSNKELLKVKNPPNKAQSDKTIDRQSRGAQLKGQVLSQRGQVQKSKVDSPKGQTQSLKGQVPNTKGQVQSSNGQSQNSKGQVPPLKAQHVTGHCRKVNEVLTGHAAALPPRVC